MKPALVCTTYDPTGRVLALATPDRMALLRATFEQVVVVCGLPTSSNAESLLGAFGVEVRRRDCQRLGLYRAAVQAGIERADHFMYVDFDRVLHWSASYPDELRAMAAILKGADFTLLGRTPRAFNTHPACQRLTEGPVNALAQYLFPKHPPIDLFGASWGLSRAAANILISAKLDDDSSFYAAWPALLWRASVASDYVATEGLEWETPDFFAHDVERMGLTGWLATFESAEQWQQRVTMAAEWVRVLLAIAEGTHP